MVLDEAHRSVTNKNGKCWDDDDHRLLCIYDLVESGDYIATSAQWKGSGYYRLMEPAGVQLAEFAPGRYRCGANQNTGWLQGKHPDRIGEEVYRTACFDRDMGWKLDCRFDRIIRITNCNGYYVYFLPEMYHYIYGATKYCGANPN